MNEYPNGLAFSDEMIKEVKDKFYYVDEDPILGNDSSLIMQAALLD